MERGSGVLAILIVYVAFLTVSASIGENPSAYRAAGGAILLVALLIASRKRK